MSSLCSLQFFATGFLAEHCFVWPVLLLTLQPLRSGTTRNSTMPAFLALALQECADFFNLPYTGVINRPDLQDILLDECKVPGAACDAAWNGWTEIKKALESEMKLKRFEKMLQGA